jgi:hypothetical protein
MRAGFASPPLAPQRRRRVRCAAKGVTGRITYWKDGQELEITEDEMPEQARTRGRFALPARACTAHMAAAALRCAPARLRLRAAAAFPARCARTAAAVRAQRLLQR